MSTRRPLTFVLVVAVVLTGCSSTGDLSEPVTPSVATSSTQTSEGDADETDTNESDADSGLLEIPTEMAASAFIAVDPLAFADPGTMSDPMSGVHFVSPSLNLGCAITGARERHLWGCFAASAYWTWPTGPDDYCANPEETMHCSSGIEVVGDGMPHPRRRGDPGFPAAISVSNGNAAPTTLRVLEYGQSISYADVTCYSEFRGMTCVHMLSTHGFVIARDLNSIF